MPVSPDLVFCCGDVDALAASLKNLLSDRSVLTAFAANALARIETWSPRENVAGIVEAIRTAALRKRRFSGRPVPSNPQPRPDPPTRQKAKSEA
jgi:hypothetical protein